MDSTLLYLSGDWDPFEEVRSLLTSLGSVEYVSSTSEDAFISGLAVLLPYLPMAVGLFQGAKVCEHNDIPLEWYTQEIQTVYPQHIEQLLEAISTDHDPTDMDTVDASVRIWGDGAKEYADCLESVNLDARPIRHYTACLPQGSKQGVEITIGRVSERSIGGITADHPTTCRDDRIRYTIFSCSTTDKMPCKTRAL